MKGILLNAGLFLFCLINVLSGQNNAPYYLSREALRADLDLLKFQLESVHAGLYEYSEKRTIDAAFSQIENSLSDSLSDLDFYRVLAPLQKIIKNGHTMVIPSERWSNYKVRELPLFPFEVHYQEEKLYILKNLSEDSSLEEGTEILSINGIPAKEVIDKLVDNITRDGNNETYPLHLMCIGFEHWYADIIDTPAQFELELKSNESNNSYVKNVKAVKEVQMNALHLERYGQERFAWYLRPTTERLNLKINQHSAILRVPSFDSDEKSTLGENYKRFYKRAFKQIKLAKVNDLILDLRNNGGGDPMPQLALLSHLLNEPIQLYKSTYTITNKIPNPEHYPDDKIKKFNWLAKLLLKKREDRYEIKHNIFARLQGSPPQKLRLPQRNLYQGNLYILINGASFSATGETAGILKDRKRGVFIGEETGGSDWQNTSGRMWMLHLPHSGVRVRMPVVAFELNVADSDDARGVLPEHNVSNSINDVLAGKDAILEYTIRLINASAPEE